MGKNRMINPVDESLDREVVECIQSLTAPHQIDVVEDVMARIDSCAFVKSNHAQRVRWTVSIAASVLILMATAIQLIYLHKVDEPKINSMFAEIYNYSYFDDGSAQTDLYQNYNFMYE